MGRAGGMTWGLTYGVKAKKIIRVGGGGRGEGGGKNG